MKALPHHSAPFLSWALSFDTYDEQGSEVRLINFSKNGRRRTLITFSHSILISKRRCFRRFDEVRAIHFPAQRGPFSLLPFVLTLGDNHIGDLSLARPRLCRTQGDAAAGLARATRESTPFSSATETERKVRRRGSIRANDSAEREEGRVGALWRTPQLPVKGGEHNNAYHASAFVSGASVVTC